MKHGLYITGRPTDQDFEGSVRQLVQSGLTFTFEPVHAQDSSNKGQLATRKLDGKECVQLPPDSACSTTPLVPLGKEGAAAVERLVRGGCSFHYVKVHGSDTPVTPDVFSHIGTERPPRDLTGELPGGLVCFGSRNCPFTVAAVQLMADNSLPFFYIDITGNMGHYHEGLGDRLKMRYMFAPYDKKTESSFHSTVPIIFLDKALIGGRTQLQDALDDSNTREKLIEIVNAFESHVRYFPKPTNIDLLMQAARRGHIVRHVGNLL